MDMLVPQGVFSVSTSCNVICWFCQGWNSPSCTANVNWMEMFLRSCISPISTVSPIMMEVENGYIWKVTILLEGPIFHFHDSGKKCKGLYIILWVIQSTIISFRQSLCRRQDIWSMQQSRPLKGARKIAWCHPYVEPFPKQHSSRPCKSRQTNCRSSQKMTLERETPRLGERLREIKMSRCPARDCLTFEPFNLFVYSLHVISRLFLLW